MITSAGIFAKKDLRTNKNNNPMNTYDTTENLLREFTLKYVPANEKHHTSDSKMLPVLLYI